MTAKPTARSSAFAQPVVQYSANGTTFTLPNPDLVEVPEIADAIRAMLASEDVAREAESQSGAATRRVMEAEAVDLRRNAEDIAAGRSVSDPLAEVHAAAENEQRANAWRQATFAARNTKHAETLEVINAHAEEWAKSLEARVPATVQKIGTAVALLREAGAELSVYLYWWRALAQGTLQPRPEGWQFEFLLPGATSSAEAALASVVREQAILERTRVGTAPTPELPARGDDEDRDPLGEFDVVV